MFRIMIIPTTTNIKILHITRHQEFKTVPGIIHTGR